MSNAPQGPGWWLASDGKYYPPQPVAPPAPPPAAAPPPVPPPPAVSKKNRVWLWVLLGALVALGGCTVVVAGVLLAVGDAIDESRDDALAHVDCAGTGVDLAGHVRIEMSVHNTSDKRSDSWVTMELRDGADFLGSRRASLVSIPAGATNSKEIFTDIDAPPDGVGQVTCTVIDGVRTNWG